MKQKNKIRVAVLYGGRSAEHEVSLKSAANVIQYLDPTLFEVIPIGIDKKGNWLLGEEVFVKSLEHNKVSELSDDSEACFAPEWIGSPPRACPTDNASQQLKVTDIVPKSSSPRFDVVFPAVHGTLCEDGTLQGLLEIAGIPYVGCGVLSSAVGMDKDVAKRLAMQEGINVAPYLMIKHDQWKRDALAFSKQVEEKLSYPVFVKPANTGSSIGITKVKTPDELTDALNFALQFDNKILIEKALVATELELAVLESLEENHDPIVSKAGEILPQHEFYSYDAKYIDENGALFRIPAPISETLQNEAQFIAKKLFLILECESMARVDLFLDKITQQIYFNEINTLPGFTQISMYPKLMEAAGIPYSELLTHLIQLALKRHQNKSQLKRDYAG